MSNIKIVCRQFVRNCAVAGRHLKHCALSMHYSEVYYSTEL
jgi:hypothetical protein